MKGGAAFTVLFFICNTQSILAQEIRNLRVDKVGDNINLTFELRHKENPQELYEIDIYSSHDEYSQAVELISGKTEDVFPSLNMKYVIDAKKIYNGYKGDVDFKVVATLMFTPLTLVTPKDPLKTKVGKPVTIMWKGGGDDSKFKVDYSNNGGPWTTLEENLTDTQYTWNVPKKQQKGTYSIKLSSDNNKSKSVYSGNIVIKKKTSPFVFVIPIVAGAAAAYFLLSGDDGGTTTPPSDDPPTGDDLPLPPGPPSRAN